MWRNLCILLNFLIFLSCGSVAQKPSIPDTMVSLHMELSAFGVESDNFPSISARIDFEQDTGSATCSFYNPKYPTNHYSYSKAQIDSIRQLLQGADLSKFKSNYTVSSTDQPTSTITVCTKHRTYSIKDYGLVAPAPFKAIYKIVYKLSYLDVD